MLVPDAGGPATPAADDGRGRRGEAARRERLRRGRALPQARRPASSPSSRSSARAASTTQSVTASQGSGFVVSDEGYILTNSHVVTTAGESDPDETPRAADTVYVQFRDGERVPAEVVGWDVFDDVGVLKVDPADHPVSPVPLGDSSAVVVGEPVAAIGSPFGQESSLSVGVVSATERSIDSITSSFNLVDAIQTDAPINRGNSGGPMFNAAGEVIGINAQIRSESGTAEGVGFAIPINAAKRSMEQLIQTGEVRYAWLGVTTQTVTPRIAERFGFAETSGAAVQSVAGGSPADRAGLVGGGARGGVRRAPVLSGRRPHRRGRRPAGPLGRGRCQGCQPGAASRRRDPPRRSCEGRQRLELTVTPRRPAVEPAGAPLLERMLVASCTPLDSARAAQRGSDPPRGQPRRASRLRRRLLPARLRGSALQHRSAAAAADDGRRGEAGRRPERASAGGATRPACCAGPPSPMPSTTTSASSSRGCGSSTACSLRPGRSTFISTIARRTTRRCSSTGSSVASASSTRSSGPTTTAPARGAGGRRSTTRSSSTSRIPSATGSTPRPSSASRTWPRARHRGEGGARQASHGRLVAHDRLADGQGEDGLSDAEAGGHPPPDRPGLLAAGRLVPRPVCRLGDARARFAHGSTGASSSSTRARRRSRSRRSGWPGLPAPRPGYERIRITTFLDRAARR